MQVQTNMTTEQRVQYYIIVGSYSSENAEIQVTKLKVTFSNADNKKDGKIRVYVEQHFQKKM